MKVKLTGTDVGFEVIDAQESDTTTMSNKEERDAVSGTIPMSSQELERYREGFADALQWILNTLALEEWERELVEKVLDS